MTNLSRRTFLQTTGLLAAGAALPGVAAARSLALGRTRVARFAHLTDFHIQPEKRGVAGVVACLEHVQTHKPDFVITGGDLVMDTFATEFGRSKMLWETFTGTLRGNCSVPVEHCIGNHDIFGWNKAKSKATGTEPQWGKNWAMEMLGLSRPYRSFDRSGWHFVVLDSVYPDGDGYTGKLDPEQAAWLDADLSANAAKPTIVISHIPVLAMCAVMGDSEPGDKHWNTPYANMMSDGGKLHARFCRHGVKLALSGHIHLNDRVEMGAQGAPADAPKVTYICDGAVCGSWWDGRKNRCDEGYGLVDLYDDGTFEHRYVTYGWKAGR